MTTILILGYLISVAAMWLHVHKSYSKGGAYHKFDVGFPDIVMTILPVVNTLTAIIGWIAYHPQGKELSLNKLFLIKD